jgi:hypothetical protein
MIRKVYVTGSEKLDDYFSELVEAVNILTGDVRSGTPGDSWTIVQIKAWLDQEDIDYNGTTLKADLLELCQIT